MIGIDDKARCCGCGGCAQVCPAGCIEMREDGEGFLYPEIDAARCLHCDRCEQVCPVLRAAEDGRGLPAGSDEPKALGGWHRDAAVREASSSGGAFTLLARAVLSDGGVVFGAVMNGYGAEHAMAESAEDLAAMRGSKYVQSAMKDAYKYARDALKEGRPVLFTGTPCQTAGLISYLGSKPERLVLVDFVCHGVPSPKVLRAYMESVEVDSGARITAFSFREKDHGWHPSGLQMGTKVQLSNGRSIRRYPALRDTYMNGFLEDMYLRPSCYECAFKTVPKWGADITIADFWGVDKALPEMNDGKGTSLMLIHTPQGQALFDRVKDGFEYRECDWRRAVAKNPPLLRSAKRPAVRDRFFAELERYGYNGVARRHMTTAHTFFSKLSKLVGAKLGRG